MFVESSLFPREVGFSLKNNHASREKEFKLPPGTTKTFFPQGTIMSNPVLHIIHYA
jgi:hypothetical protein